jgi:hypothetical protein
MPELGYTPVKIIHPETGGIAEVPDTSLWVWFRSGWRRLKADDIPPDEPQAEPAPMSQGQVEAARQDKAADDAQAAAEAAAASSGPASPGSKAGSKSGSKNTEE